MRSPHMLYRIGTKTEIWGIKLDTVTVDEHEVPEFLADGWHAHPFHARDAEKTVDEVLVDIVDKATEPLREYIADLDKPRRGRPPKAKE